jgi:hypothetical protein
MMQKLTRREMIKLAGTVGLAVLFGAWASGINPEEKIEELEQPTEESEEKVEPLAWPWWITLKNGTRVPVAPTAPDAWRTDQ